jgi:RimJ/RimL family protein N-acetyltransferase
MKPPVLIDTPRLRLRLPEIADAQAIFERYAQDADVTRYLIWQPHRSIEETMQFLKSAISLWREARDFSWVITRKPDYQLIGMIALRIEEHKANLGYVLAKAYWGQGYMTEAAQALINLALAEPEIYRIWAVCDIGNPASARVLEKVGMSCEGVLRRWIMHPNVSAEPRDCLCYSLTK